jgi:hypothetical protein
MRPVMGNMARRFADLPLVVVTLVMAACGSTSSNNGQVT